MSGNLIPTFEAGSPADPMIVFLHAAPLSSRMWQPQIERLQDDYYCLAPDLPGHGKNKAEEFTLTRAAERVIELIGAKSPGGKAAIVGLSLGGAVALEIMRLAPQVPARIMLSGTAARLGGLLGRISLATAFLTSLIPPRRQAQMMFDQLHLPEAARSLVWDDFVAGTTPAYNRSVIKALMDMQLPVPTPYQMLVAVGEKETPAARQAAHKLLALYPSSIGVIAPDLRHLWNLEQPDLFTDTVHALISGGVLPKTLIRMKS